jgi:hypothetical protein
MLQYYSIATLAPARSRIITIDISFFWWLGIDIRSGLGFHVPHFFVCVLFGEGYGTLLEFGWIFCLRIMSGSLCREKKLSFVVIIEISALDQHYFAALRMLLL